MGTREPEMVQCVQAYKQVLSTNLIRVKEGDEWKTAFKTRYGMFEYKVLPCGLANAPSVFQRYVNNVLKEHIDRGVVVYIDDILIYANSEEN